ncbi:MAG: ATP-binding cassette domain-containing protein, partial [Hyphomicrobiaceae bacterium]
MLAAADENAAQPPIIRFDDVRFGWPRAGNFDLQIRNFEVACGETTLLIGPSGSGKSTFLSLLCGIVTPQQGRITVLGQNTAEFSASARDRFRSEHFGIIFQMFNLLPYASVIDNVTLPIHFAPERKRRATQSGSVEEE